MTIDLFSLCGNSTGVDNVYSTFGMIEDLFVTFLCYEKCYEICLTEPLLHRSGRKF
jgi:hypothetical protein